MKYRPEIDGLRALAVLPGVFFHAGFSTFRGGFIGVDVFYVLSGFLIPSLILEGLDRTGRVNFGRFYAGRARRLLPALLLRQLVKVLLKLQKLLHLFYSAHW